MEVLTEFIRNPPYAAEAAARAEARNKKKSAEGNASVGDENAVPPAIQCPDIHAALDALDGRNDAQKAREERAAFQPNLVGAALSELNLDSARMAGLPFQRANFRGSDLSYANLHGAYLRNADLRYAYLDHVNLTAANLQGAFLEGAYLNNAFLGSAFVIGADLTGAYLRYAHLIDADLRGADLRYANLGSAKLTGTSINQDQIDSCQGSEAPLYLPNELTWPFVENDTNEWVRSED